MLKRQKVILALLGQGRRGLSRTQLVKLTFLLRYESSISGDQTFYDFMPYKYGPFSFTLYREVDDLARCGYIDDRSLKICDSLTGDITGLVGSLPPRHLAATTEIMDRFGKMSQRNLIDYVYDKYPWFATRSELRHPADNWQDLSTTAIYTAGYQGESIDYFLNKLLRAGIARVIDVRANPVSRKYGFSKSALSSLSKNLGMEYSHYPQLGVPSALRKLLTSADQYEKLLTAYAEDILPELTEQVDNVRSKMLLKPSVLVCFERSHEMCHRSRLASAIAEGCRLSVIHL